MNTPISFELAKLLKEKGFDEITGKYWAKINQSDKDFVINKDWMTHKWNSLNKPIWSAPTIAEVVMWLYEKHGIWIYTCIGYNWEYVILEAQNPSIQLANDGTYNSSTKAYEAAIEYCLNKLI